MSELLYNLSQKAAIRITKPVTAPTNMVTSGTYLYPLTGIYYFATHSSYWCYYLNMLAPQMAILVFVYVILFVCLYPICVVALTSVNGPMAIVTSWYIILDLCTSISKFFSSLYLFPTPQNMMFDSIMSREGSDDVVLKGKMRRIVKVPFFNKVSQLILSLPMSILAPFWVIRLIILFAIGRVPVVGPLIVSMVQAPTAGISCHARYFALKGMDERQIKGIYKSNTGQYMGFGLVASYLESIPILGIFFMFTNTAGAALWAVSIEQNLKVELEQVLNVHQQKVKVAIKIRESNQPFTRSNVSPNRSVSFDLPKSTSKQSPKYHSFDIDYSSTLRNGSFDYQYPVFNTDP